MGLKTSADYAEMLNRHFSDDIGPGSVMTPGDVVKAGMIALNDPAIDKESLSLAMPRTMDIFVVWAISDESVKKAEAIRRKYRQDSVWTRCSTIGAGAFKTTYYVKAKKSVANAIMGECSRTHFNQSRDVLITAHIMRRCKQCPVCKQAFLTSTSAKIYCSHKCYELARKSRAEEQLAQTSDI